MNQFESIKRFLLFRDIAVCGDSGWFCNIYYNALCRLDLETGKINLEAFLPSLSSSQFDQYGALAYYDEKLFIAPMNGCNILIYDLTTKGFTHIQIDLGSFSETSRFYLFHAVYLYNDAAYFIPARYPAIVKLDLNTFEITYIDDWHTVISKQLNDINAQYFQTSYLTSDGICILPCWQSNTILEVDFNTEKWRTLCVNESGSALTAASYSDQAYLVSCKDKAAFINIKNKKEPRTYTCTLPGLAMVNGFGAILEGKNDVWCIPLYGNMIVKLNRENGEWICVKQLPLEAQEKVKALEFVKCNVFCIKRIRDFQVLICSNFEGKILLLDIDKETIKEYESVLDEVDMEKVECNFESLFQSALWMEHFETDLAAYIQHIQKYKNSDNKHMDYGNTGKKIFHELLEGLTDA